MVEIGGRLSEEKPKENWRVVTDAEALRIQAALNERWGADRKCPMCDRSDFIIVDRYYLKLGAKPLELFANTILMPSAVIVCRHCGNTIVINLTVLGIEEQPK